MLINKHGAATKKYLQCLEFKSFNFQPSLCPTNNGILNRPGWSSSWSKCCPDCSVHKHQAGPSHSNPHQRKSQKSHWSCTWDVNQMRVFDILADFAILVVFSPVQYCRYCFKMWSHLLLPTPLVLLTGLASFYRSSLKSLHQDIVASSVHSLKNIYLAIIKWGRRRRRYWWRRSKGSCAHAVRADIKVNVR